MEEELAIELCA